MEKEGAVKNFVLYICLIGMLLLFSFNVHSQQGQEMTLDLVGDNLVMVKDGRNATLSISAIINGTEYDILPYFNWNKQKRRANDFKFGGTISIPRSKQLGEFIANNLEEVKFIVRSNNALRPFETQSKEGFRIRDSFRRDGFNIEETFIDFDFFDIFNISEEIGVETTFGEEIVNENITISLANITVDVRDLTFTRGQVFDLDPTITISTAGRFVSFDNNITKESGEVDFSHLSITDETNGFVNETNMVLYFPLIVEFNPLEVNLVFSKFTPLIIGRNRISKNTKESFFLILSPIYNNLPDSKSLYPKKKLEKPSVPESYNTTTILRT